MGPRGFSLGPLNLFFCAKKTLNKPLNIYHTHSFIIVYCDFIPLGRRSLLLRVSVHIRLFSMHFRGSLLPIASAGFRQSEHEVVCLHIGLVPTVTGASPAYLLALIGSTRHHCQPPLSLSGQTHPDRSAHVYRTEAHVFISSTLIDIHE